MKLEVGKRYVMRNGYITNVMQETGESKYAFKDGTLSWKASGEYSITGAVSHLDIVSEYVEPQPEPQLQQPLRWVENCKPDKPGIWAWQYTDWNSITNVSGIICASDLAHAASKGVRYCYLGPIPEILPPKKKVVERLWLERLSSSTQDGTVKTVFAEHWLSDDAKADPSWIRTDRTREVEQ